MEQENFDIYKFIEFVIDLVQEDDYFMNFGSAKQYFLNGGCYELFKVVKNYFPDAICMIKKDGGHCAILYEDKLYDATGELDDIENFDKATEEDFPYMEDLFGIGEYRISLKSESIIAEVEKCDIKGSYYK